jgi:hypothetical protein
MAQPTQSGRQRHVLDHLLEPIGISQHLIGLVIYIDSHGDAPRSRFAFVAPNDVSEELTNREESNVQRLGVVLKSCERE